MFLVPTADFLQLGGFFYDSLINIIKFHIINSFEWQLALTHHHFL